jgi:hypothetical protein
MTAATTANVLDEAATNAIKQAGSDTVTSWLQSFRNNLKSLFASVSTFIEKTSLHKRVYGTDDAGNQTTYDVDRFGKVDKVNNITPDGNKNVKTDYVYESEVDYEADKANIPTGATVVKLYEYPDNIAGFMIVPDYANQETTNRISTNNGTWTADRTGFVVGSAYAQSSGTFRWFVNNKIAARISQYNANWGCATNPIPVKKGDVVKFTVSEGSLSGNCDLYFIPPAFIKKEMPVIVEKNGSYSLEEVKTADTWIDGKPIYKKSFNFGTKTFAANSKGSILDNAFPANDVETVVKQSFSATDGWSNLTGSPSWTDRVDESGFTFFLSMSNSIQHRTKTASTLTNLIFTIEYTKTTD